MKTWPLLSGLAAVATAVASAAERTAVFWMEPYANLTSIEDYKKAWHQWGENKRPGYIMAGSAYAAKRNGSLGYANTAAGEGNYGILMEKYGIPALKSMGLTTIAMVYFTHYEAISKILANPEPFIDEMVAKAKGVGLDGFDLDYEPQQAALVSSADFMSFLSKLGAAMKRNNLILTMDISGCPTWYGFDCSTGFVIDGLKQANTMSSFNAVSVDDFKSYEKANFGLLREKWAPGFEPHNTGETAFAQIISYMLQRNVSTMATWEYHETNLGDQPQWLFDTVNAFLDGRDPQAQPVLV